MPLSTHFGQLPFDMPKRSSKYFFLPNCDHSKQGIEALFESHGEDLLSLPLHLCSLLPDQSEGIDIGIPIYDIFQSVQEKPGESLRRTVILLGVHGATKELVPYGLDDLTVCFGYNCGEGCRQQDDRFLPLVVVEQRGGASQLMEFFECYSFSLLGEYE